MDSSADVHGTTDHVGSRPGSSLTLRVQQPGDAQLSLRHAESLLQVLLVALAMHQTHVDQVGSVDAAGKHQKTHMRAGNIPVRCLEFQTLLEVLFREDASVLEPENTVQKQTPSATRMFQMPSRFSRMSVSALSEEPPALL